MKRGPKPKPVAELEAQGTFRPARHAGRVDLVVSGDPPIMPDYLPPDAQLIWQDVLPRVMQARVVELDSEVLARYCVECAFYRRAVVGGMSVPAADKSELSRMEARLRIGGPDSRVGSKPKPGALIEGQAMNPYANRGQRGKLR